MRILVVEDEPRMAELLWQGLTEEGHIVTVAADGRGGLELAECGRFVSPVVSRVKEPVLLVMGGPSAIGMPPSLSASVQPRKALADMQWIPTNIPSSNCLYGAALRPAFRVRTNRRAQLTKRAALCGETENVGSDCGPGASFGQSVPWQCS